MHMSSKLLTFLLAGGLSLALAVPAMAHAALVSSDPAPNSAVAAPKAIKLTFSEKLAPRFSGFSLSMREHGMAIKLGGKMSEDGKSIIGTPAETLMTGAYTVSWHAASTEDGHRMEGSFNFTVK